MSDNTTFDFISDNPNIENKSIIDYAESSYLEYSMSVNKGRALPFTQDGLKPVIRRVLHAMNQLNLQPNAAPAKSARVVGEVIGKYHPHGDTSVYEAMVRTAQPFSMRYPLVLGQGNFGSRDGDGPAAMRYTEVKLTKHADLYLSELKKGTVDWAPNYDGSFEEPKLTPVRLPMLLANGSSGIGVGMACDIPSHNLTELCGAAIHLIKNPNADIDDMLTYVKGPDLPCGAQIISNAETIRKVLDTGRGSLRARAVYHFEELARGQWNLVIDEIPPDGSVAQVMQQIEECLNPKIKKTEKALTQGQLLLKQLSISMIDMVRDESGRDHSLRLVITPTTSKVDRDALLGLLFKNTKLESGVPYNMVAVDRNGTPRSINLIGLLQQWIGHRFYCVTRRTQTRLDDVNSRMHILEGRSIVFLNVDEVIRIVRTSENPKEALMERFSLSEIQADDILDMRLRQLANLEGIRIEQDLIKLRAEADELNQLLTDPAKMRRMVIIEVESDAHEYGDARRTLMLPAEPVSTSNVAVKVVDEPLCIIISEKGWIRSRQGLDIDVSALNFKEGDKLDRVIKCRSIDNIIAIATDGRVFSTLAGLIQGGRGDGVPLTSIFEFQSGQKLAHILSGNDSARVLMSSDSGYGFICPVASMVSKLKAGKAFMTVRDGVSIATPLLIPESDEGQFLVTVSSGGKLLAFPLAQMKTLNAGGQGVIIMGLNDGETIRCMEVINEHQAVELTAEGKKTITCKVAPINDAKYMGSRARKGCMLPIKIAPSSIKVIEV